VQRDVKWKLCRADGKGKAMFSPPTYLMIMITGIAPISRTATPTMIIGTISLLRFLMFAPTVVK